MRPCGSGWDSLRKTIGVLGPGRRPESYPAAGPGGARSPRAAFELAVGTPNVRLGTEVPCCRPAPAFGGKLSVRRSPPSVDADQVKRWLCRDGPRQRAGTGRDDASAPHDLDAVSERQIIVRSATSDRPLLVQDWRVPGRVFRSCTVSDVRPADPACACAEAGKNRQTGCPARDGRRSVEVRSPAPVGFALTGSRGGGFQAFREVPAGRRLPPPVRERSAPHEAAVLHAGTSTGARRRCRWARARRDAQPPGKERCRPVCPERGPRPRAGWRPRAGLRRPGLIRRRAEQAGGFTGTTWPVHWPAGRTVGRPASGAMPYL